MAHKEDEEGVSWNANDLSEPEFSNKATALRHKEIGCFSQELTGFCWFSFSPFRIQAHSPSPLASKATAAQTGGEEKGYSCWLFSGGGDQCSWPVFLRKLIPQRSWSCPLSLALRAEQQVLVFTKYFFFLAFERQNLKGEIGCAFLAQLSSISLSVLHLLRSVHFTKCQLRNLKHILILTFAAFHKQEVELSALPLTHRRKSC